MRDRRVLLVAGAVLFAVGFGVGYLARGEEALAPSDQLAPAAGSPDASQACAPSTATGATGESESAPAPTAAAPIASRGEVTGEGAAPRGAGTVAVVGRSEAAAIPTAGSARTASASSEEPPPPLDGGARPTGRLDATAIRDVVRSHRDQLGFCFAWQLHLHPELRGQLTMDFTIGEDGAVTRAEVSDDALGDQTVLDCFRSVTRRMQFPSPEGGEVRVRYPFILAPEDPPEASAP